MEDSFEPVRAAAMEGLGTLAKIVGERPLVKELEGLDDIKKGRVKEYMEKAEVKAKSGIKAAPAPRPNPSLAPSAAPPAKTTQVRLQLSLLNRLELIETFSHPSLKRSQHPHHHNQVNLHRHLLSDHRQKSQRHLQ